MKLFDALYNLAFVLQDFVRSTATDGSQTTLVDTVGRFEGEDFFDNGTLFIKSGNNADKALVISSWNGTSKTFTFASQASACAAADIYAAIPKDFPKGVLVESINQALVGIGKLPETDATLVTVAYQEEYTLPTGIDEVKRVEIANSLTTPYLYVPNVNWVEREGLLVFDTFYEPKVSGYKIRLSYNVDHGEVDADSDTIDDLIHPKLLTWAAAVNALRWRMIRNPEEVGARINEAMAQEARYIWKKPKKFKKDPKFSRWF
jgi:hypothetical protein